MAGVVVGRAEGETGLVVVRLGVRVDTGPPVVDILIGVTKRVVSRPKRVVSRPKRVVSRPKRVVSRPKRVVSRPKCRNGAGY